MELVGYLWYSLRFRHLSGSHVDTGTSKSLSTKSEIFIMYKYKLVRVLPP